MQLRVDMVDDDRIKLSSLMYLVQKLALIEKEFASTASERVELPDVTEEGMALATFNHATGVTIRIFHNAMPGLACQG